MRFTKIFLVAIALFAVACEQNEDNNNGGSGAIEWVESGSIVGEWTLTSWANNTEAMPRVYIAFNEDNTFDMYQQSYSVVWLHYDGIWSLNGTTLTGEYSDGILWTHNYTVTFSQTPKLIRLTSQSSKNDVSIYSAVDIPDEIEQDATESANVRSVEVKRFL